MKLTVFTTTIATALIAAGLMSNADGPADAGNGNRTGGPGSTGTCTSCHSGGGVLANAGINLRKKSNNQLANGVYSPGATYIVEVSDMHPTLIDHGFQVMALNNNNTQAGAFQNMGSDKHIRTVNGIVLAEHSQPIRQVGAVFTTTFEWVAPASGSGAVDFYGVLNAVNNDGTTNGDAVSAPIQFTLTEDPVSVTEVNNIADLISVYPNPASNVLHISGIKGAAVIEVYSLSGKLLSTVTTSANDATVSLQELAAGVYSIRIYTYDTLHSKLFIKQ